MSTIGGGVNIVTNGLVLYLDAANTKSYVSGSTTWNDISRIGNNGTLVNGPTFNSGNGGSIVFDGTNDFADFGTVGITSPVSFTSGNFSINHWIRVNGYQGAGFFGLANQIICKGTASTYNYATQISNSTTISFVKRNIGEDLRFHNFNVTSMTNRLVNLVFTVTTTQVSLFLNGTLIETQNIIGTSITPYANDPINIGGNGSNIRFNGNMYQTSIHNRALTATEVLQNYNATKSRYGL